MALDIVTWVSWLIFALDYLVRLSLAADHWRWFYRHLFDLLVVVLPLLRPRGWCGINRVLDEIERLRAQVRLLGGQSEHDTER
jgi:hypothetical protein